MNSTTTPANANQARHDAGIVDRTKGAAHTAFDATREKTSAAVGYSRDTASHAYDSTRKAASNTAHKTADGIETNPLSALIGGLAVGVAVGALLPKTQQESKHLGALGKRINDSAASAARAARDAGKQELNAMLPDRANAKDKAASVLGTVVQAAKDGGRSA